MCYEWPPPRFEYVDLWQYSDNEIHDYIKILCEFMNMRQNKKIIISADTPSFTMDDIPF